MNFDLIVLQQRLYVGLDFTNYIRIQNVSRRKTRLGSIYKSVTCTTAGKPQTNSTFINHRNPINQNQKNRSTKMQTSPDSQNPNQQHNLKINQRVHSTGDYRRIGTVKYIGEVKNYSGIWIGVDWDNCDGKHDGSVNGVRYFTSQFPNSASFVRPHNLSSGVSLLQALNIRYRTSSTKEELGIHFNNIFIN